MQCNVAAVRSPPLPMTAGSSVFFLRHRSGRSICPGSHPRAPAGGHTQHSITRRFKCGRCRGSILAGRALTRPWPPWPGLARLDPDATSLARVVFIKKISSSSSKQTVPPIARRKKPGHPTMTPAAAQSKSKSKSKVAIVGTGLAGLTTAFLLRQDRQQRYSVTLFEQVRLPPPCPAAPGDPTAN